MNRPIKFRAWDKKVKGFVDKFKIYNSGEANCFGCIAIGSMDEKQNAQYWAMNVVVMQYTGLKDKNGKEIYEGDILIDDVGDILEVKFGELPLSKSGDCICTFQAFYCKCYGQLGKSPMYECQNIGEWMEIIGNIYENPELLTPHST